MRAWPTHSRRASSPADSKGASPAIRVVWAGILALHLAAVPGVIGAMLEGSGDAGGLATLTRLLGLLASAGFFVLKIIDLPCLRLKPGWRSTATALLIVGLLHWGVIEQAVFGEVTVSPSHLGVVLFVVAVGQTGIRVPVARWLRRFRPAPSLWRFKRHAPERLGHAWSHVWLAFISLCTPIIVGPRPPPTCC